MISDDSNIYRNPIQSNPIQNESNPNPNTYTPDKKSGEEWFEEWWSEYPKKVGKGKCRVKFLKIVKSKEKFTELLDAIKEQNKVYSTKPLQYIPLPETWLNQGRWEDTLQQDTERPDTAVDEDILRIFGKE